MLEFWSKLSRKKLVGNITPLGSFETPTTEKEDVSVDIEEHQEMGKAGITFAVDSVTPAGEPIWTETLADNLARRFQRKVHVLPEPEQPVIGGANVDIRKIGSRCHPLLEAVHIAFSQHRPLTLSPDSIWLVIAQGFGHHVAENAEALCATVSFATMDVVN